MAKIILEVKRFQTIEYKYESNPRLKFLLLNQMTYLSDSVLYKISQYLECAEGAEQSILTLFNNNFFLE
jgi:hypothetical protein